MKLSFPAGLLLGDLYERNVDLRTVLAPLLLEMPRNHPGHRVVVVQSADSSEPERPRAPPAANQLGAPASAFVHLTLLPSLQHWKSKSSRSIAYRTSGWCPARSSVGGTTSERALLSPCIFQMEKLKPRRGDGLFKVTQPIRGLTGSPESLGLHLVGAPVRVEMLPGCSQESKEGGKK